MKVIDNEVDNNYQEDVTKSDLDNDNIYMTREFKFKELNDKIAELNSNPLLDNVMEDSELSLDLFEDLKPVGDTIITEPIVDKEEKIYNNDYKGDMYSSDTSDIDVIKDMPKSNPKTNKSVEEDFFTNSYSFSNKDFNSNNNDEEFFDEKTNSGSVLKIILLLLAIAVFIFVIVYFVMTYGIGV